MSFEILNFKPIAVVSPLKKVVIAEPHNASFTGVMPPRPNAEILNTSPTPNPAPINEQATNM